MCRQVSSQYEPETHHSLHAPLDKSQVGQQRAEIQRGGIASATDEPSSLVCSVDPTYSSPLLSSCAVFCVWMRRFTGISAVRLF